MIIFISHNFISKSFVTFPLPAVNTTLIWKISLACLMHMYCGWWEHNHFSLDTNTRLLYFETCYALCWKKCLTEKWILNSEISETRTKKNNVSKNNKTKETRTVLTLLVCTQPCASVYVDYIGNIIFFALNLLALFFVYLI